MKNSGTTASKSTAEKKTPAKSSTTASKAKSAPAKSTAAKSTAAGKVKAKSSAADGLRELFVDSLKDIYWAEKALLKALPKMAKVGSPGTELEFAL